MQNFNITRYVAFLIHYGSRTLDSVHLMCTCVRIWVYFFCLETSRLKSFTALHNLNFSSVLLAVGLDMIISPSLLYSPLISLVFGSSRTRHRRRPRNAQLGLRIRGRFAQFGPAHQVCRSRRSPSRLQLVFAYSQTYFPQLIIFRRPFPSLEPSLTARRRRSGLSPSWADRGKDQKDLRLHPWVTNYTSSHRRHFSDTYLKYSHTFFRKLVFIAQGDNNLK